MLGVCLSAGALAILHWSRSWAFLPIALGSYAFALIGYLAMVTALLVVNWQALFDHPGRASFWPWVIPTLLGTPLIAWVARKVSKMKMNMA